MNINQYAANKLKELRTAKNMTQEELAEDLNITQQQVARYENNLRQFKQDFLFKLAEYFKVSINDFFPPINSYYNEMIADEMGIKYINNSQLSIITGLPISEIEDILSGKNKNPKPSSLIKIGEALDKEENIIDPQSSFTYALLISAGYVEDPESYENKIYNTGIRYLLEDNERKILCRYLISLWNTQSGGHVYTEKEVYNTIFSEDKKSFSTNEVRNMMEHSPTAYIDIEKVQENNNDNNYIRLINVDNTIDSKIHLNNIISYINNNKNIELIKKYNMLSENDKELINNIINTRINQKEE